MLRAFFPMPAGRFGKKHQTDDYQNKPGQYRQYQAYDAENNGQNTRAY